MIHDGRTLAIGLYGEDRGRAMDPREYLLALYPDLEPPPIEAVDEDAPPLLAEVNHGVWIARCPCRTPGMPAPGGVVFFDWPLVWCPRCENRDAGGRWRRVWGLTPGMRDLVERLLSLRPDAENRNWTPAETLEDLARQNAEHGIVEAA